jgi:23S rRNA (adenine2503-C2)-methyltransferase
MLKSAQAPMPVDLLGQPLETLQQWVMDWGQPRFRALQIYHALYAERVLEFERMTTLPRPFRELLRREATVALPTQSQQFRSADGSVRYLLRLPDRDGVQPAAVETVDMPSANRRTLCISTQAGCAVNCRFCLTAQLGLVRNLTAGEILGQILVVLQQGPQRPRTNIVFMGQGEPLLNYEATLMATRILLDPRAFGISPRRVTLSTSGIVPAIERLAGEPVRPKLAISLNATTDEQRSAIMPINRKYPLSQLLEVCRRYPLRSWEKLTFEYVLLGGFNDAPDDARRLVRLLRGLRAKVNLIPWNPGPLPFRVPAAEAVEQFRETLIRGGVAAFIRYSRGRDVMGACGQLALLETPAAAPVHP